MRYFILLFLFTGSSASTFSQRVPEDVLNAIISEYTTDGFRLEQVYRPNFTLVHPNVTSRLLPCYIGRKALVLAVMAKKPVLWMFKLKSLGKLGKIEPLQSFVDKGTTYWMDFRVVAFRSDMTDKSNHCLFVQAADDANYKLPIYTIILTTAL